MMMTVIMVLVEVIGAVHIAEGKVMLTCVHLTC